MGLSHWESVLCVTAIVMVCILVLAWMAPSILFSVPPRDHRDVTCTTVVPFARPTRLHPLRRTHPGRPDLPLQPSAQATRPRLAATTPATPATPADTTSTIFVSVPAYRDPETPHTVWSALSRAHSPQRVVVGVCEQHGCEDTPFLQGFYAVAGDGAARVSPQQLRVMRMPARFARGPVFARSLIEQRLYRGEDFLLMVDSHMQFAPDWDVAMLAEHAACPTQPAVLSTYPDTYSREDRGAAEFRGAPNRLTFGSWEEGSDMPMWATTPQDDDVMDAPPSRSVGWAAGWSFAPREAVRRVPFHHGDMFPHLFFGEEVGMAVRFFTSGVDVYTPRRNLLLTTYERDYRPLFWDEVPDSAAWEDTSRCRMRAMLGMRGARGVFGWGALGTQRSLAAYFVYSGINLHTLAVTDAARQGVAQL